MFTWILAICKWLIIVFVFIMFIKLILRFYIIINVNIYISVMIIDLIYIVEINSFALNYSWRNSLRYLIWNFRGRLVDSYYNEITILNWVILLSNGLSVFISNLIDGEYEYECESFLRGVNAFSLNFKSLMGDIK